MRIKRSRLSKLQTQLNSSNIWQVDACIIKHKPRKSFDGYLVFIKEWDRPFIKVMFTTAPGGVIAEFNTANPDGFTLLSVIPADRYDLLLFSNEFVKYSYGGNGWFMYSKPIYRFLLQTKYGVNLIDEQEMRKVSSQQGKGRLL